MDTTTLENLLVHVKILVEKHEEINQLNGSNFNIFSILKMDSKENKTHSAFISELLKPEGSHGMGSIFLELFLKTIQYKHKEEFITKTAKVYTEHHAGSIDIDKETGGRIDIYILDENNRSISIENKIYAGDQLLQLKRYYNYNKNNNSVYYLNLDGKEPDQSSSSDLNLNVDYSIISYDSEIITWLEACQKEASDYPILRESIKQYRNLIKKLTNTMNKEQDHAFQKVILSNLIEADYISKNLPKILERSREKLRNDLIKALKLKLDEDFTIEKSLEVNQRWSKFWIRGTEKFKGLEFGIEPFGGDEKAIKGGLIFIGIFNNVDIKEIIEDETFDGLNQNWVKHKFIPSLNGIPMNTASIEFMNALQQEETSVVIIDHITSEIMGFIEHFSKHLSSAIIIN